jgi:hypothetical protein
LKITDVSLTLFAWDGLPATRYAVQSRVEAGSGVLGLLTLSTDDGLAGHAFLGSALYPANVDTEGLIRFLKPLVLDRDPLKRERIVTDLWTRSRMTSVRSIGAIDVALWDLAGKIRDSVPGVCEFGDSRLTRRIRSRSRALPVLGLARLQDPSAAAVARRHRGLSSGSRGGRSDVSADARCRLELFVRRRGSRRARDRRTRFPVVRRSARRARHLQLREAAREARHSAHGNRVSAARPRCLRALAAHARDRLFTRRRRLKGGITTLVKAAHLAEAFGLKFEVHHGGNSLNNVANLHVLAAIGNADYFEVLLPDAAHRYGLEREIDIDRDGLVHAPMEPGLGVPIDFALIERKALTTLR